MTCYTPIANQLLDLFLTGRMTESEIAVLPNGIVTLVALGTSSSSLQATSRKILGKASSHFCVGLKCIMVYSTRPGLQAIVFDTSGNVPTPEVRE